MNWLVFALIGTASLATTAILDKFILFVFGAAALFLGEILTPNRYAGGVLLVLSAFLASYKPEKGKTSLVLSPAVRYLFFFWVLIT